MKKSPAVFISPNNPVENIARELKSEKNISPILDVIETAPKFIPVAFC